MCFLITVGQKHKLYKLASLLYTEYSKKEFLNLLLCNKYKKTQINLPFHWGIINDTLRLKSSEKY